jgi:hypothetical protein
MEKYCYNCDNENDFFIKKITHRMMISNIYIEFEADTPFCKKCQSEISYAKYNNKIIEIANKIYNEKKENAGKLL